MSHSTNNTTHPLLKGLNPEQLEVVMHFLGPLLVVAVAGAGKTRALVHRIAYLVKERAVDPARVLAVTFSRDGAKEMNERLIGLLGRTRARIGTFHSLARQILLAEQPWRESWDLDDRGRYRYCVKEAVDYKGMKWKQADISLIVNFVSRCKAEGARPDDPKAKAIAEAYQKAHGAVRAPVFKMLEAYHRAEEIRLARQQYDFDDMLFDAVELLATDENVRASWAARYDFVLQDEAQDQNWCQLMMGELLARDHRNYMLVGDPSQTIYTWRGAQPRFLLDFEAEWQAKVVKMARNYRCGSHIISAANKTLDTMDPNTKIEMSMICERPLEGDVSTTLYHDLDEEGEQVTQAIQNLLADGVEPRAIGVLYRLNAQSRAPEEALLGARVPYRIVGGANFYGRKEVKDLLAYLRLAEGRGTPDDLKRAINSPFRFLGAKFVEKVKYAARAWASSRPKGTPLDWPQIVRDACKVAKVQYRQQQSAEKWAAMIERMAAAIKNGPQSAVDSPLDPAWTVEEKEQAMDNPDPARPVVLLEELILETGYTDWLSRDQGEESPENNRVSNVRELVRASRRFGTVGELLDYIEQIAEEAAQNKAKGKDANLVTLTTVHKAKGLEWPIVFFVGANDKIIPHHRCEDVEEERRIFYVAATRARDALHISHVSEAAVGDKIVPMAPSPFLSAAGLL